MPPGIGRFYTVLSNRIATYMWPNRAADPTKANALDEAFKIFSFNWSGQRAESWYLDLLGVDPDYQGKGHGRDLVRWGMVQAENDDICASVISSYGSDGFYNKQGLFEVGRANVGPLLEVKGGSIMFCDTPRDFVRT